VLTSETAQEMRVLHVAETIQGGVGTYINQVVPLQVTDFGVGNVKVVAPADHLLQIANVPSSCIESFSRPARSIKSLLAMAQVVRTAVKTFKPDLIHVHSTFGGAVVRMMYGWRRKRPKLVYCPHGWAFDIYSVGWKRTAVELVERLLAPLCDRIVAVSSREAEQGRRIGIASARLCTILNAISPISPEPEGRGWSDDRLKVLFIGRLDRQKGFDLVDAAVADLGDRVCVRAAGSPIVGDQTAAPTSANVELLGWLTPGQIEAQLEACDMLVAPSRWEAFGLTALEGMRAGKAVVATNVGGLPEVVEDGVSGILIPPEDVLALREAILVLGADNAARQAMGRAGRQRFLKHFTINRLHDEILSLYRLTLKGRQEGVGT
jgi:glycosyltransferase involved in cell wall biosynthesis